MPNDPRRGPASVFRGGLGACLAIGGLWPLPPALALSPSTCPSDVTATTCFAGDHTNDWIAEGSTGGAGAGGGTWDIYSSANLTADNDANLANLIKVTSAGGTGDTDSGTAGPSGNVTLTNDGSLGWSGPQSDTEIVLIYSLANGGAGQEPSNHGDGGPGGDGGTIQLTNSGGQTLSGTFVYGAIGIDAEAHGGAGGAGNDSAINHHGGNGGDGGAVTLGNTASILLGTSGQAITGSVRARGIGAVSSGGSGGANGYSNGTGDFQGNGGAGQAVSVTSSGAVGVYWTPAYTASVDELIGILASSAGGNGSASAHNYESGGNGGAAGSVTLYSSADIDLVPSAPDQVTGAGVSVASTGGNGGTGNKQGSDDSDGQGGSGGGADTVTVTLSHTGQVSTGGDDLPGVQAISRGGAGGSGGSGYSEDNSSGGAGGSGGAIEVQLQDTAGISTTGSNALGIVAQSIGGYGGDGGNDGGLIGSAGGAGNGGDSGTIAVTAQGGTWVLTQGDFAPGIAAQSIGGGGGTGGDFVGVLGTAGNGGRGGSSADVTITTDGRVQTGGAHAYGLLAQSIAGGGGAGGVDLSATVALGSSGGVGGSPGTVTLTNAGALTTGGYAAHAMLAQSVGGGGGAAGLTAGAISVGGSAQQSTGSSGGTVTVNQTGTVTTTGLAASAVLAQSIGGGGGSGAGAAGIISVGGGGSSGGDGGAVYLNATAGSVGTAGAFAHGLVAHSIGGGGGSGGDVLDFSVGTPTVGVGGNGASGGMGGTVQVDLGGAIATAGDHANGVLAQSVGGGGGAGGNATGLGGVSLVTLTIGGNSSAGGAGGAVTVTAPVGGGALQTAGSHAVGVLAQSIGGGGGNGGNASGYDTELNFAASVAVGGKSGAGGAGEGVTVSWQGGSILTGAGLRAQAVAGQPIALTGQAGDSYGILAQSIGGGGGAGGSASVDQLVFSIPDGDLPLPTVNLASAVGAKGGAGGNGGTVAVTVQDAQVESWGSGAHGVLAQSVGGGGGTGGDGSALNVSAAIPDTTSLPAIQLNYAMGGTGGVPGNGLGVTLSLLGSASVLTYGDNANGLEAQSIGGGGGDGGVGSSSTFTPGEGTSLTLDLGLGGTGGGGGTGGTVDLSLDTGTRVVTVGSGARGLVAQSIGGGGGTSQGGTGALYVGPFIATVQVGRPGGGGGTGGQATVTNAGTLTTGGGDADGILAQSIGGGGGLGGTFAADGSADDPNWVDVVLDIDHVIKQFGDDGASYTTTVTVGGKGGIGGNGMGVTVSNPGLVQTVGDWADGIVAQSIGGGGGAGGTAVADGSQQSASINVGVGGSGGGAGNGGTVTVHAIGVVETQGYGAYGILAQSIGGGGGQGGDGSTKSTGTITVGSGAGGGGGTGGTGGTVCLGSCPDGNGGTTVLDSARVTTLGDNAHAILVQSIGGGGGTGGAGNTESAPVFQNAAYDIVVGGMGGASGQGQSVSANVNPLAERGLVSTQGARAFGLVAQSIGGGGGIAGAGSSTSIGSLILGGKGGSGDLNGGTVGVLVDNADLVTSGPGSHAIVAQSIGGGGGIGGDASSGALAILHQGNNGNYGSGGAVTVTLNPNGTIATTGAYAFGILAQSISGGGGFGGDQNGAFAGSNGNLEPGATSGAVSIEVAGAIHATGAGAIGVFAQSDALTTGNGSVTVVVSGTVVGGDGPDGYGVFIAGGNASNALTIESGGSLSAVSGNATNYSGDATLLVANRGRLAGNLRLRNNLGDLGRIENDGDLLAGTLLDAHVTNRGRLLVGLDGGAIASTRIGGDFTQTAAGRLAIDADLAAGRADRVSVDGRASLAGGLDVNLLAIAPGGEAQVLSAAGGIDGAPADPGGSVLFDLGLDRRGDGLWLTIDGASFNQGGLPGNLASVADHLQAIWNGGSTPGFNSFFLDLDRLAAQGQYPSALADLSPGVGLAPGARGGPRMQGFTQGLLSCPRFEGDATLLGEGSCVWARFLGDNTSGSRYQGTSGFDDERRGVQAGGQWELSPNWFVGASWHYEETRIDGSDRRVSTDGTDSAFGLSIKHTAGPWLFAAALGGGMGWYDTDRQIRIPGHAALARDSSEVHSLGARLRAAYEIAGPRWYFRPMIDAELIAVRVPGHRESGAGTLGLAYDSASQTSLAVTPALELGGRLDLEGGYTLRPFVRLGVSVLSTDDWTVSARLAGAPAGVPGFETAIPLDRVTTQVSAGLQLWAAKGLDLRLGYDGAFSGHATSHGGTLTLAWDF